MYVDRSFDRYYTRSTEVIRLRRAGREQAIVDAIKALNSKGKHQMHTKGEICRKMGVLSTSKIRDLLRDMADSGRLVIATTAMDGYSHEIEIFGIPKFYQLPIPTDHEILINGVSCRMSDIEVQYAQHI